MRLRLKKPLHALRSHPAKARQTRGKTFPAGFVREALAKTVKLWYTGYIELPDSSGLGCNIRNRFENTRFFHGGAP